MKLLKQKIKFSIFVLFSFCLSTYSVAQNFNHPGITHKKSDLDRMKYMVEAQIDPWYSSYQTMISDSKSSYDYEVRGDLIFYRNRKRQWC